MQLPLSYHIVDYKTARISDRVGRACCEGSQDELFPLYKAQLNAYAFIADGRSTESRSAGCC